MRTNWIPLVTRDRKFWALIVVVFVVYGVLLVGFAWDKSLQEPPEIKFDIQCPECGVRLVWENGHGPS